MLCKRIIPCLDTVNGRVVKGVNFVDLVDIGDPIEIAKRYEEQGADEIVLLDITATNEERESMYALLKRAAAELTVPLALGGGIRTVEEFGKALECGAAKVSVNSAAVKNPDLIREASERFGSERVVVAIDGKGREVMVNGGMVGTGLDIVDWAKRCEALGAGEILFTAMGGTDGSHGDGSQDGYDIPMTRAICEAVSIPVIASGGCGCVQDVIDVFRETGCDAALVASLFHYGKATVGEVKAAMRAEGIPCR
ncbi:MAG: imidazole glycerol phosphate synthase subunit HisF [Oscillospiraceae bacterium]|nr:imidazole glycerol phosphate synthase subunit HisF [Oscillospiraceae bacterium]